MLSWYFEDLFPDVLDRVQNLVVIGYGFRDEHINEQISRAVEKGLGIVVLTPDTPDKLSKAMVGSVSSIGCRGPHQKRPLRAGSKPASQNRSDLVVISSP